MRVAVLAEAQDLRAEERRLRREHGARPQRLIRAYAEELQGEADGRPLARYVVLQVGVEPLVLLVHLRREGDDDHLLFGRGQPEGVREAYQRERRPALDRREPAPSDLVAGGGFLPLRGLAAGVAQ